MPITDNRTQLVDGENAANVSGETTAAPTGLSGVTGTIIEGTDSIEFQMNDNQEMLLFDQSTADTTFNVDMSDMTVYQMIKFGTAESYGGGSLGGLFVFGDTADGGAGDTVGYICVGADVPGFPYEFGFFGMKLDVSVVVASPGTNNVDYFQYSGTEAGLNHAAVLQIGYGSFSLVKAVSTSPNAWSDGIYYIANDSYAATIDGGTSGTPETMADIAGDDVVLGAGLINNPKGSEYGFFGPTEWGTPSGTADSYFTASNEQWYWIGDNAGGHAVAATHFPFRFIGNATGTNSVVLTNVVIVNTGTAAEFDVSDANMDTVEFIGCLLDSLASFGAPTAGTSALVIGCTLVNCGLVTGNEADFDGTSFLTPTVAADAGAINWNETISTAHTISELDNTAFSMGSNNHHAISFPTTVSDGANLTLRNIEFTGFDADGTGDSDNSMIELLATTGTITLTLEGCTVDGASASDSTFTVDTRAGCSVVLVFDTVTTSLNLKDPEGNNEQNVNVWLAASDGTGDLPFNQAITSITQAAGSPFTRTVTFTAAHGLKTNDYLSLSGITNATEDNSGAFQVTVTSTTICTYISADTGETTFTGTILGTGGVLYGLTDASGNRSSSRTWGGNQPVTGQARKSTSSPRFKTIELNDTILSASGLAIARRLVLDE